MGGGRGSGRRWTGPLVIGLTVAMVMGACGDGEEPEGSAADRSGADSSVSITSATGEGAATDRTAAGDGAADSVVTDVVASGDGWEITVSELEELVEFVEQAHGRSFLSPVGATAVDDIGQARFSGAEPLDELRWEVFVALRLVGQDDDRQATNGARLDRIRGLCCEGGETMLVLFENQASETETAMVIVHELSHALHLQHSGEYDTTAWNPEVSELVEPLSAPYEGVPQWVALEYLSTVGAGGEFEPIFRPQDLEFVPPAVAALLSFVYVEGPVFVDAVVDERGADALAGVFADPPLSSEQVLFPDRYLAGDAPVTVEAPTVPDGSTVLAEGVVGAYALSLLGSPDGSPQRELVEGWAGDRYVLVESPSGRCLSATIELDDPAAAGAMAEHVSAILDPSATSEGTTVRWTNC